jgi:hypothetical protein
MVKLISSDEIVVDFQGDLAKQVPYIKDAFTSEADCYTDVELHVLFANAHQLNLLKIVLVKKVACDPTDFIPRFGKLLFGDEELPAPPFVSLTWDSCLGTSFELFSNDDLVDLLIVADGMAMWDLRQAVAYTMIHRMIVRGDLFELFFNSSYLRLIDIVKKIYRRVLENN